MKDKKVVGIILAALVVLIGGAGILYTKLGRDLAPEQMVIQTQAPTESADTADGSTEGEAGETAADEAATEEEEEAPILAPDFTVYDAEGNEVHLSDYLGKPVILNFWASWCGPCQMEMPDFDEKYQEIGEDVQFLMVNVTDGQRETVESASKFIEEEGYTFPVFFDTDSNAALTYRAFSLPTTYFIDAEGRAIAQATGAIDMQTLETGIDLIYRGE